MSCNLRIAGKEFDVNAFISASNVLPYNIWHINEPRHQIKPNGTLNTNSGLSIEVSKASFTDLKTQVADALHFLNSNSDKLQFIKNTSGIDYAVLDFGVDFINSNGLYNSFYFPTQLISASATCGIGIEISVYLPGQN